MEFESPECFPDEKVRNFSILMSSPFSPFPEIITARLHLREIRESDVNEMFILRSDERVMKYIERPRAKTKEDSLEVIHKMRAAAIEGNGIMWAITMRDENRLIGTIGFWRGQPEHFRSEIGYALMADYHRMGITHEAMQPVLKFGFSKMKLHSIEANVNPLNTASAKVLERNGFVREAYFRENYFWEGKFLDTAIYSLINAG